MEWNLKATSWDLTELLEETVTNTDTMNGNGSISYKGDFRVDLKLGQVGNSGEILSHNWKEPGLLKMESSSISKKARSTGTHRLSCLVDECDSDLSNCRDYHRRHKVCELHSKAAQVMINGLNKRFCQQCSRFHSVEEFDEGKRSCRTRLDKHNRRRRKPQPDPLSRSRSYFSNYQGSQMLPFSSLQVYPSTNVVKTTWSGVNESRCMNLKQPLNLPVKQNLVLGSSSSNYREGKQCTLLQGESRMPAKASASLPGFGTDASISEGNEGCNSMSCDRLTSQVRDSDCALSLLSSPLPHTSGIGLSNMVQPQAFPLMPNYIVEPMVSGMFHVDSGGSSGSEAHQTLPFHWQWDI